MKNAPESAIKNTSKAQLSQAQTPSELGHIDKLLSFNNQQPPLAKTPESPKAGSVIPIQINFPDPLCRACARRVDTAFLLAIEAEAENPFVLTGEQLRRCARCFFDEN